MSEKKNYMSMKDAELLEIMDGYGIDKADFTNEENGSLKRASVCKMLKVLDVQMKALTKSLTAAAAIQPDGEVVEDVKKIKLHKKLSGMMVQCTFYNVDEQDLPYIQLGLNGIALIVPREKEVWIPKEFIDGVLRNAIQHKLKMHVDRDGKITYIPKAIQRFQHQVHDIKHIDALRKEFDEKKK